MVLGYRSLKYPSPVQIEIWSLRRTQLLGKEIAEKKQISKAAVSKALKGANERILAILENAATMNKIQIEIISEELGFVRGYSCLFNVKAYITYSPINNVQVWYDHKGTCERCEEFVECRRLLLQEFKERKLSIPNPTLRPTELGEVLFKKLEGMIDEGK